MSINSKKFSFFFIFPPFSEGGIKAYCGKFHTFFFNFEGFFWPRRAKSKNQSYVVVVSHVQCTHVVSLCVCDLAWLYILKMFEDAVQSGCTRVQPCRGVQLSSRVTGDILAVSWHLQCIRGSPHVNNSTVILKLYTMYNSYNLHNHYINHFLQTVSFL